MDHGSRRLGSAGWRAWLKFSPEPPLPLPTQVTMWTTDHLAAPVETLRPMSGDLASILGAKVDAKSPGGRGGGRQVTGASRRWTLSHRHGVGVLNRRKYGRLQAHGRAAARC